MSICHISCDFCTEFSDDDETIDRTITQLRDKYVLIPTLGCFREGYCLYMPLSHKRSFAVLGGEELATVENELEAIRGVIAREYTGQVILAEHGPGLHDRGASCCDHAHMHVIPVHSSRHIFLQFYRRNGDVKILTRLAELEQYENSSYIYLSCGTGQHFVWQNASDFGRQFVRQVCAEFEGLGPMYNWRTFSFRENMMRTKEHLRKRFSNGTYGIGMSGKSHVHSSQMVV